MISLRPARWQKIINPDSETCEWIAEDGTVHPGTAAENSAVRQQLLEMRIIADRARRLCSEERY